jgi:alpha-ketoglutaric semialdehyde dehydrogenase
VDQACNPAEDAFPIYVEFARIKRADLLEHIALEIDQRGADIMAIASAETGLLHAQLEDDRSPTRGRLRLFAGHIRAGAYLDRRHEAALPARKPAPYTNGLSY